LDCRPTVNIMFNDRYIPVHATRISPDAAAS
jgi:hypothetical protein